MLHFYNIFHHVFSGCWGEGPFLSAYIYIAKMKMLTSMAYRFDFFTSFLTQAVLMVSWVFLWKAAFATQDVVGGVTESEMLQYAIVSMLLSTFYQRGVQNTINNKVREGEVAVDLFHPISVLGTYLAQDIGAAVNSFFILSLPLALISVFLLNIPLAVGGGTFLLFLACCLLSFAIQWILSALIGIISFWLVELGNLGLAKDAVVAILSGSIVPLWFFPESIQNISRFLPFKYIFQAPISIFVGKMPADELIPTFVIQAVWVLAFSLILMFAWGKAKKKVVIQGG